jgi:acyl-CoA synthetase (NDP forming)
MLNPPEDLHTLFFPRAVAVIGASNVFGKWGFNLAATLLTSGFSGPVYLVNPREKYVLGRKAYPDPASLPAPVDLAVLAVPALQTIPLIEALGRLGIPNALVIASNFKEVGEAGARLELRLVHTARACGVRIVGPNTMGLVSTPARLEILFMPLRTPPGPVDIISQSGNIGTQIMELGQKEGVGVARFVGSGNEAMLGVEDYLNYFGRDDHSKVIVLYLESIRNGEAFFRIAREITPHKPVLALKAGKTRAGASAARSHSGAVSQSPKMVSDLFRQAGIIEAQSTEELIDLLKTFSLLAPPRGDNLGVVSLGGGWGVATADAAALKGLPLPPLSQALIDRLDRFLPPFWSRQNPLDLVGTPNRRAHIEVLRTLTASEEIDAVIALGMLAGFSKFIKQFGRWSRLILKQKVLSLLTLSFLRQGGPSSLPAEKKREEKNKGLRLQEIRLWTDGGFVREVRKIVSAHHKPILLVTFLPGMAVRMTRRFQLPVFGNPERAVGAMGGLIEYARFLRRISGAKPSFPAAPPAPPLPTLDLDRDLNEWEGKRILEAYSIPVTRERIAATRQEVFQAAEEIGYPLALKILSSKITHKTERGGVMLHLKDPGELEKAVYILEERFPALKEGTGEERFLVQEMVPLGVEVLLGMVNDPHFGPILVAGLGGLWVEVFKDVAFAQAPLDPQEAEALWRSLKGWAILEGIRGKPPGDIPALIQGTVNFSRLVHDLGNRFEGIDVNPLMVLPLGHGVKALDAVFLRKKNHD